MRARIIINGFLGRIQRSVWFEECVISKGHDVLPEEKSERRRGGKN